jgi:signal transduction histidine kinase
MAHPVSATLDALVHLVERQAPGMLGSIHLAEAGRLRHGAAPSLPSDYNRAIDGLGIGPCMGSCGTAAWRKEQVIVSDIRTDPLWVDFRELAATHGLRACWSTPILGERGQLLGTFAMYYREPRRPTPADLELVDAAVRIAAPVIERHLVEEERDQLLRTLRVEQARLQNVFTQAPAAIVILRGPNHVFESANPAYLEIIGWRDVLEKPVADAVPEVVEQGIIDILDRVYRTGEPFVATELRILLDRRPDHVLDESYFNFVYQPLRDTQGDVCGIFAHGVEVTDQVRARQEIEEKATELEQTQAELEVANEELIERTAEAERAKREAEAANAAKSQFLATMSHELRTPLNAIAGYVQLLEMGLRGALTDEQREDLARIRRNQRHLLGLINDVLNFAKLDAGQVQFEVAAHPIGDILVELEALVAPQMRGKGLRYTYESCDPSLSVHADRDKVEQIVLNLLTNAIKFTPTAGRITVACDADEQSVHVRVRDTGVGIPPERMDTIFSPFVQVDPRLNRPHEGIGLGLAISHDLARAMGGDLAVESEVGVGSVFTLALPRAHAAPIP